MAVPVTHSGKAGKGRIGGAGSGGTTIHLHEWTVRETPDEIDGTTAEDEGYLVPDTGCIGIEATVRGYHFLTVTDLDPLFSGQRGTDLYLYTYLIGADIGPFWRLNNFVITGMVHSSRVRDRIEFEFTAKSRGTFTRPITV